MMQDAPHRLHVTHAARAAASLGYWWTLFRSPDLDSVVKQAITGNLTLDSERGLRSRVTARQYRADGSREKLNAAGFGLAPNRVPLSPNRIS
jgi:hypothetical protein